ncbi:uncharacterized protein G2W53_025027 [Senna tora]|uniref:Uncharacterized protein n=1 Tax=Senna tora TaxID=362788 RepID=A0A834TEI5_9FABA|nr:uncharacterized protein G2W53_025027 [Senna tora]
MGSREVNFQAHFKSQESSHRERWAK